MAAVDPTDRELRKGETAVLTPVVGPNLVIGRERELTQVGEMLERFVAGEQPRLVVSGEVGIGKSALLRALAGRAGEHGVQVIASAAYELGREEPLGFLVDTFDGTLAPFEEALHERLGPGPFAKLAQLLPSLASDDVGFAGPLDGGPTLYRALAKALERIAAQAPVLLLLDDVQWADDASLSVIAQLLRRPPARVMPVLAHRSGAVPDLLTHAVGLTSAAEEIAHLQLAPLDPTATSPLIGDLAPARGREILRESGGNPFYLLQLAAAERGDEGARAALRAALSNELSRLSADARAFVTAAAVLGDPFDPVRAAEVAELAPEQAMDALQELVDADLTRATDRPDGWILRRPVVAQLVREWAGDAWLIAAHERAARATAAAGASLPEQARHVERCARQGDTDAAALLADAAVQALPQDPLAATRWLGVALRVLGADGRPEQRLRLLLYEAVALDAARAGSEAARGSLNEALELLPRVPEDRRADALAPLARVESALGRHPESRRLLERMSPSDTAELYVKIATTHLHVGDWEPLARNARRALSYGRRDGDEHLRATAGAGLTVALSQLGDPDAARDAYAESTRIAEQLEPLVEHPEVLAHLATAGNEIDLYATSVRYAELLLEAGRRSGYELFAVVALVDLAHNHLRLGNLANADEAARDAVAVAGELRDPFSVMFANEYRSTVALELGRIDEAVAHAEVAVQERTRLPAALYSELAACALGRAYLATGDADRAIEVLLGIGGVELAGLAPTLQPSIARALAEAELARGDVAAARWWSERCSALAAAVRAASTFPTAELTHALILLEEGDGTAARGAAARAVEGFEAVDRRLDAAYAGALLGRALVLEGDEEEGIARLRDAHEALTAAGAGRRRDDVAQMLRQLGRRVPGAGRAKGRPQQGPAALSRREREIAALLARGATNRQIAEQLVISEKTVESHLGRVFTKLGVSSRTAAALAFTRHQNDAEPPA